jgi:glycerol-3-phosphate dehydrogenase
MYQDGQFDDSRLAINSSDRSRKWGLSLNYTKVVNLLKDSETK